MRFIFIYFPVAIWNFPFLRIFLNRISTAGADRQAGQYHNDALVYNARFWISATAEQKFTSVDNGLRELTVFRQWQKYINGQKGKEYGGKTSMPMVRQDIHRPENDDLLLQSRLCKPGL